MSRVDYRCGACGHEERPMNHRNPSSGGCTGTFRWEGARMVCEDCGRSYRVGDPFWCTRCREWSRDYEVW